MYGQPQAIDGDTAIAEDFLIVDMEECLRCGNTGEQLLPVAESSDPNDVVGRICSSCEEELVWDGIEVGSAGTCGYSEDCNRMAAYVTLDTETAFANTSEAITQIRKRNNILCEHHFDELQSESDLS